MITNYISARALFDIVARLSDKIEGNGYFDGQGFKEEAATDPNTQGIFYSVDVSGDATFNEYGQIERVFFWNARIIKQYDFDPSGDLTKVYNLNGDDLDEFAKLFY
jgi:hypothetical protein